MKPKLIALNLLLLAAIGAVIWQIRISRDEARRLREARINVSVRPAAPSPSSPAAKPEIPPAAHYVEVADKNLFSKDRNATVVVEVPVQKVEPPKIMPALPVVYGVMGLPSGTKAIMAEKSGAATRPVRAGESIGEFKVLALNTRDVVFEWNGIEVPRRIEDLVDRSSAATVQASAPSGPAAPSPNAGPPRPVNMNPTTQDLGIALTETQRACKPGDTAPAGAVVDGFRKEVNRTPFGDSCRWVKQ